MKNIDITALDTLPVAELAALPPAVLVDLQDEVDASIAQAKKRRAALDQALDRRYSDLVATSRRDAGKDTGTVRLDDDGHHVVCEAKKSVYWDQAKLSGLQNEIRDGGQDPDVYIITKTELTVREAAYATWPSAVREAFEPARTVKPGKPSYRIERPKAEAA